MASFSKYKTTEGEFWMIRITLTDPVTREKRKTSRRGFKKLSEAKLAAKQLEAQEARLGKNMKSHYFYKDIFLEFEEEYSKHLKPSTIYRKSVDFKKWILPTFGNKRLKDITKRDCQKYIDFMSTQLKSYKPLVIQARNVFDFAVRNDYIESSPFNNTVYPKTTIFEEDEKLEKFWNKEQSLYFLEKLKETDTLKRYALFRTLLLTGMRKGELLALQESDLHDKTHTISITKTLFYDEDGNFQLLKPKTSSSVRDIHLDPETFEILKNLIRQNKKLRLMSGEKLKYNFIFIKETSFEPFRNSYVNEVLNKLCKRFDLPRITVHGLRHSCASLLFAAGVDIKVVQKLLGHAHIETTMNIYTHVTTETIEKTTDLLIDYLNEPTKKSSGSHMGVTELKKQKNHPN
ncbi:tyrosine-type recombinase/integrase [Rummeliibacillus sp. POC4]|uniref:tyrosine-type recombinase/integrase n=1 Tax=Rummeliibacillus sp. POC4 TaxID=2305899 RepID=UPI000E6694BF|nr:tyrosine-type recombinase/integrase [Rummeliibacillus sp. POC4]RIJ65495.1 site-specific integrase [Rummeliibacillus sp. POC4]